MEEGAKFPNTIPDEYGWECSVDRDRLTATVVAANIEIYPEFATRVAGGWLVYDKYLKEVVELDENLGVVRSWGRQGPGPGEYGRPVAALRLPSGGIAIVDKSPPSIITLGDDSDELLLNLGEGVDPNDAIMRGDGRLLVSGNLGTLHIVTPGSRSASLFAPRRDFAMPEALGTGAKPAVRLTQEYVGFLLTSTIWKLDEEGPRKIVERCVPEGLGRAHEDAPTLELGTFPGTIRVTLHTMRDFQPIPGGFLTLGALKVNDQKDRSIERYDDEGNLRQAWRLEGFPGAKGRFDRTNPRRLMVWDVTGIEGVLLVELNGDLGL